MRLTGLEVDGFRAFGKRAQFDLDGDAVVLVGPNGCGKTSLLDAILWALAGEVPRLGADSDLVSLYSSSGGARAGLTLKDSAGSSEVRRFFDGERSSLSLAIGDEDLRGSAALARMCELFWPEALAADDEAKALSAALTRSVYLQQDRVRQFVEADTEQDRFAAVSELVGAGRIAELQVQLDRERTSWSRATNERTSTLESRRTRLATLESRLDSLAPGQEAIADLDGAWTGWWSAVASLGVAVAPAVGVVAGNAPQLLDTAVRQLGARRRDRAREVSELRTLASDLDSFLSERAAELPDIDALRATAAEKEAVVGQARQSLALAEAAAAEERRRLAELRDTQAELQTLAQLALRHLGERCPVCEQEYDHEATRQRLALAASGSSGATADSAATIALVTEAAARLQEAEAAATASESALREGDRIVRALEARRRDLAGRLEEYDLSLDLMSEAVGAVLRRADEAQNDEAACVQLIRGGEELAVRLSRSNEAARRGELQQEIEGLRAEIEQLAAEVASRELTSARAVSLLEGLREAGSEVVRSELERVEPLLQQIFSTIDPHPAFRAVRLLARFANRRGRVNTRLEDTMAGRTTQAPEVVLSSSQLNGLAVSIFLSLNLGVRALPLDALVLDDPLQSLDDVNLLGLVDLLRRAREHRQIIVSTHDPKFGDLLARKLRPVHASQRTIVYRFVSWGRSGPVVERDEIRPDSARLRLASPAA